jgi:hypothetical protein
MNGNELGAKSLARQANRAIRAVGLDAAFCLEEPPSEDAVNL